MEKGWLLVWVPCRRKICDKVDALIVEDCSIRVYVSAHELAISLGTVLHTSLKNFACRKPGMRTSNQKKSL